MFTRALFMKTAVSLLGATAAPSPRPWDICLQNPTLPYDRPLAMKMRVLDGPDFDLIKYRGMATLLHIFASWCEPCAVEMPHIVDIATAYAARGLRVVGIDYRESDNTVRAYRKRFGIPFPIAMDEDGTFTEALEEGRRTTIELPASLYVTPDGYLYCYTQGSTKNPGLELTYRIEKFLNQAPPAAAALAPSPSPSP